MKNNTYLLTKKAAKFIILVASITLVVFGTAFIYYYRKKELFEAAISMFFVVIAFAIYFSSRKKGILDKVLICNDGLVILRGLKKRIIEVPWRNISSIDRIRNRNVEMILVYYTIVVDGKQYAIKIEPRNDIEKALTFYYKKAKESE